MNRPPLFSYDPALDTVFVHHGDGVHLATQADVDAYFATFELFMRRHGLKQVFIAVDYDGFTTDPSLHDAFGDGVAHRVVGRHCAAEHLVRFGGTVHQRATARLVGMRTANPSNLHSTRAAAVAYIRSAQRTRLGAI